MSSNNTLATLQNLYFSENKPQELKPIDVALLTYLVLRQTEDHFIYDSQLTLADRLGCSRDAIADSVKRLAGLGWIVSDKPWSWSGQTKRRTRAIGMTVGLSVVLDKLPHAADRTKHSAPTETAKENAAQYVSMLIQHGVKKRVTKHYERQQEHGMQRLLDKLGSIQEVTEVLNFALGHPDFKRSATKSLYEVRSRLPKILAARSAKLATKTQSVQ